MKQEANSVGTNLVRELILKIHGLVGHGIAEDRIGWHSTQCLSMTF